MCVGTVWESCEYVVVVNSSCRGTGASVACVACVAAVDGAANVVNLGSVAAVATVDPAWGCWR